MIALIDYGVGNLFSLESSFKAIGETAVVTGDPDVIHKADRLILPGVGAFGDAIKKLTDAGLDTVIKKETDAGKPMLGICLGMQLLLEKSYEYGEHKGLGLIKGEVIPMEGTIPEDLAIPQIGWNRLELVGESPLFKNTKDGEFVYFVHSFYGSDCDDNVIAYTDYGKRITAAVARDNIYGTQFHPEKSGEKGLEILKAFCSEDL